MMKIFYLVCLLSVIIGQTRAISLESGSFHAGLVAANVMSYQLILYSTGRLHPVATETIVSPGIAKLVIQFNNVISSANFFSALIALMRFSNDESCSWTIDPHTDGFTVTLIYNPSVCWITTEQLRSIKNAFVTSVRVYHCTTASSVIRVLPKPQKTQHVVVLDAGHGGRDDGATGCDKLLEKNVTLSIVQMVARLLRSHGYTVILTRDTDTYVSFSERTKKAHDAGADCFISIHANVSENKKSSGIESYCIAPDFHIRMRTAYGTTGNDINKMIIELEKQQVQETYRFASTIHSTLIDQLHTKNESVSDRTLKHSITHLLLGSNVPTVLIEVGFLSNPDECRKLASGRYQKKLAQSIVAGIIRYFSHV